MDSTLFTTRALNSVEMKETLNIACTLSAGLNVKNYNQERNSGAA